MHLPRWSVAALLAVLAALGLLSHQPGRELTPTTFGVLPSAYGAMYDLLSQLDVPVRRSYAPAESLPTDAPVWWIASPLLCRAAPGKSTTPWEGLDWVQRGGTAIVFLPVPGSCEVVETLADLPLPERAGDRKVPTPETGSETVAGAMHGLGGWYTQTAASEQILTGALVPQPRTLRSPGLAAFTAAKGWQVRAALDGLPFALEAAVGAGRLLLLSDPRVLANAFLDRDDNAVFAMDLVRAYGAPRIDERDHGLRATEGSLRYLATSPALPLLCGLALLGMLYAWSGHAEPERALHDASLEPPTLTAFVDSLATLYSTSHDYVRVLDAYRELTLARLRRHLGLAVGTPVDVLLDRLISQRRISASLARQLSEAPAVKDAAGLRRAVSELDRMAEEAMR